MRSKTEIGIGIAVGALVLAGGGVAVATVAGDNDDLSGPVADQAHAAAVAAVPGGKAGKVESDGDEGPNVAYGVTVARPDGSAVEVDLDRTYHVVGSKPAVQDNDGDDG